MATTSVSVDDENSIVVSTEVETSVVETQNTEVVVATEVDTQVVESTNESVVISPVQETIVVSVATQGPTGPQGLQGIQGPPGTYEEEMPYSKRTDFTNDDTIIYAGKAAVGSLTSEPVWQISKTDIGEDGDITVLWAGGTALFDKIWDDHLSLSYS